MKREDRVHIVNVRCKMVKETHGQEKILASLVLSDGSEMSWEVWVAGGRDALLKGEW